MVDEGSPQMLKRPLRRLSPKILTIEAAIGHVNGLAAAEKTAEKLHCTTVGDLRPRETSALSQLLSTVAAHHQQVHI